jgi:hypothetical protein
VKILVSSLCYQILNLSRYAAARNALDAARAASAAAHLRHEAAVVELAAKLEREREDAVHTAVRNANEVGLHKLNAVRPIA